jgi:chromosome segregation ATPase
LLSVKTQQHSQAAATLQQQIESQSTAMEDLRHELTAKTRQHDDVLGKLASTTENLSEQQAAVAKLTLALETAEELRPENKTLQDRIADLMAHLKRLSGELEDSLDANAKGQDRIRDLESQLHDHVVKMRELRRQRGSITGLGDDQQNDSDRQAA